MRPDFRPEMTADVSTSAPRPVLTIITPSFIVATDASSTKWKVSLVSGHVRAMMSLRRSSSSRGT